MDLPPEVNEILFDVVRDDVEWACDHGSTGSLTIDVQQRRAYAVVDWYVLQEGPRQELTIEQVPARPTRVRKRRKRFGG